MNVEQAKSISLSDILHRLGHEPMRDRGAQSWYLSPLRHEKRPSFHVHRERNVWYDFGDGRGGNALDFVICYLELEGRQASVSDALSFLDDLMGKAHRPWPETERRESLKAKPILEIISLKTVQHPALVQYLQVRGLDVDIARLYLKQASVRNRETDNRFFALAFANEEGGYELRNPYFKGSVSPKAISFVRGSVVKPDGIHVFEGWPDFLTVLTREKTDRLQFDTICCNSVSMQEQAAAYIKGYGYAAMFTWMHNDAGGEKVSAMFEQVARAEARLSLYRMNKLYEGTKDMNAWHMDDLGLPLLQPDYMGKLSVH